MFKSDLLALLQPCGFCGEEIDSEGKICEGDNLNNASVFKVATIFPSYDLYATNCSYMQMYFHGQKRKLNVSVN